MIVRSLERRARNVLSPRGKASTARRRAITWRSICILFRWMDISSRGRTTRMNSLFFARQICNYVVPLDKDRKHWRLVGSMCQYFDMISKWILKGLAYWHSRLSHLHWRRSLCGSEDNYYLLFRSTEERRPRSSVIARDEDKQGRGENGWFPTYRCWFARLRMRRGPVNCSFSPGQWRHARRCSARISWALDHRPRWIWTCWRRSARDFLVKAWRKQRNFAVDWLENQTSVEFSEKFFLFMSVESVNRSGKKRRCLPNTVGFEFFSFGWKSELSSSGCRRRLTNGNVVQWRTRKGTDRHAAWISHEWKEKRRKTTRVTTREDAEKQHYLQGKLCSTREICNTTMLMDLYTLRIGWVSSFVINVINGKATRLLETDNA